MSYLLAFRGRGEQADACRDSNEECSGVDILFSNDLAALGGVLSEQ